MKPDSELTERDLCDLGCGIVHSLTCDAPNNRTGQRCIRAFHHSGECEYAERPDSELQEALDDFKRCEESLAVEAEKQNFDAARSWRARADAAQASIESLFERRIAEMQVTLLQALDDVVPWEARRHGETVVQRIEYVKALLPTPEEAAELLWSIEGGIHQANDELDFDALRAKLRSRISSSSSKQSISLLEANSLTREEWDMVISRLSTHDVRFGLSEKPAQLFRKLHALRLLSEEKP